LKQPPEGHREGNDTYIPDGVEDFHEEIEQGAVARSKNVRGVMFDKNPWRTGNLSTGGSKMASATLCVSG
jgi:hypothetical protein